MGAFVAPLGQAKGMWPSFFDAATLISDGSRQGWLRFMATRYLTTGARWLARI